MDAKPTRYAARARGDRGLLVGAPGAHLDAGRSQASGDHAAAADAIALSWLSTESARVSRSTPSANGARTVSTGEPGK